MSVKKVDFKGLSIKRDAELYRYCQAEALLKMFRTAHGRDAESMEELSNWGATQLRSKIDPSEVLTKDEINAAVKSALAERAAEKRKGK
jgi:hypothetical protein